MKNEIKKEGLINNEKLIIRQAIYADLEEIKSVVKSAFYCEGDDDEFNEWEFVDEVRCDKGFVKELSIVAVIDNKIVGYILLSEAHIGNNKGVSLGPLGIEPKHKNMGIGKELVKNGLEKAKELGYEWVALTGGNYYLQFGFEPALKHNVIFSENNPENDYLKIIFLSKNNINQINGIMKFSDSFYNEKGELL